MQKDKAVASLGQQSLLMPAWITAALAANDRLKLYLSLLQAASRHALSADESSINWSQELARAGLGQTGWTQDLVRHAYMDDQLLVLPHMAQLLQALDDDLETMARPVTDGGIVTDAERFRTRRTHWHDWLQARRDDDGLSAPNLNSLTHGDRASGDSFHLLVMDLHKQINSLASAIATENLDGAHVWHIQPEDRPLVRAFMRGLNRTAPLKFGHPGLDTAVTRDGERLLIQNDIGTNDAHVLVITVEDRSIRLTYSELHVIRFKFFQRLLEQAGFSWEVAESVMTPGMNENKPYTVGQATLHAEDDATLQQGLEDVAARIVFVIDWNRGRKRLQLFVNKATAVDLLERAAARGHGHMGWLMSGGEQLVYSTMEAVGSDAFRFGDRLDSVLGDTGARQFLLELMRMCTALLLEQQPQAVIEDKARLLMGRALAQHHLEFDLMAEHAAYCHALAQTVCDLIAQGEEDSSQLVARIKRWEHRADGLVVQARQRAERQPRWKPVVQLLLQADDVADALEETAFLWTLVQLQPQPLPAAVLHTVGKLADTTLAAIQDLVKAIEIARMLDPELDSRDSDVFLETLWRMLRAERTCDELLREARRTIVVTLHAQAAAMQLATELATTLEKASDALVATGYALRQMAFEKTGVHA